ncbi:MAG: allose kinase, partial [Firmicutes bacterium]|nr:allose kinase [Bacillota bacterium]
TGLIQAVKAYRAVAERKANILAVSVGIPAALDKERRVVLQAPNVPGLDGQPMAELLEKALGLPVFLSKDVDLLLTYDLMEQKLPEDSLIVGIYFGTGIGNSIYCNGRLLVGKNGVAGELGHIPQLHSEAVCGCGNVGCMEPVGGGRRLEELCGTVFPGTHVSQIYLRHGDAPEVRAQVDAMAATVATEVNILDPDYVIIGGGLTQMAGFPRDYFLERIRVRARKPSPMENLDIRFARPNQENGIIGAGICGWSRLKKICRAGDRPA